jgi:hypothetical protein
MSKKISELPEYIGTPQPTGSLPISIGGTTYKIDPSLLFVVNPNPNPDTVVSLNQNNIKEILNISNEEINGGFINYVLTDEDDNIRAGIIRFSTSINGKFSFYEDVINTVGQTYNYKFSMTNNGTNTSFRFFNNSDRKASVTFQKKLMINPNS